MTASEQARIDAIFQHHLAKIRRENLALPPVTWRSVALASAVNDGDDLPTVKESKRVNQAEFGWKVTERKVDRRVRRAEDGLCAACRQRPVAKDRTRCHSCMHQRRVARGWNETRAAKRKGVDRAV